MSNKSSVKGQVKGQSMKGLLKGLRYISQIFDDENGEEDEVEIQIGLPTDVKHVAHIGSDGPANNEGPSWLSEFKPETRAESSSTAIVPVPAAGRKKEPKVKSTSEDSRGKKSENCEGTEVPKPSRRHALTNKSGDGTFKKKESKNKNSKKQNSKEITEGDSRTSRKSQETDATSSTRSRNLPEIPKKSRGRKSKDTGDGESSKPRTRRDSNGGFGSSDFSENGHDSDTMFQSSPVPNFEGGGKEYR